jgi:hypothetical protein
MGFGGIWVILVFTGYFCVYEGIFCHFEGSGVILVILKVLGICWSFWSSQVLFVFLVVLGGILVIL